MVARRPCARPWTRWGGSEHERERRASRIGVAAARHRAPRSRAQLCPDAFRERAADPARRNLVGCGGTSTSPGTCSVRRSSSRARPWSFAVVAHTAARSRRSARLRAARASGDVFYPSMCAGRAHGRVRDVLARSRRPRCSRCLDERLASASLAAGHWLLLRARTSRTRSSVRTRCSSALPWPSIRRSRVACTWCSGTSPTARARTEEHGVFLPIKLSRVTPRRSRVLAARERVALARRARATRPRARARQRLLPALPLAGGAPANACRARDRRHASQRLTVTACPASRSERLCGRCRSHRCSRSGSRQRSAGRRAPNDEGGNTCERSSFCLRPRSWPSAGSPPRRHSRVHREQAAGGAEPRNYIVVSPERTARGRLRAARRAASTGV